MSIIWTIVQKDLALRVRDKSVILLGVVAPLVLTFVFDLVFGSVFSATEESEPIAVGMVSLDQGRVGVGFVDLADDLESERLFMVTDFDDEAALRAAIEDGTVEVGYVVPKGISTAVEAGQSATIKVVSGGGTAGLVAEAVAGRFSQGVRTTTLALGAAISSGVIDRSDIAAAVEDAAALSSVIYVEDDTAATRQLDSGTYFAVGLGVFFMFFLAGMGTTSMLEERRDGTLARLLAAPIAPVKILLAKAIGSALVAFAAMTVMVIASTLLMGADWGEPVGVALMVGSAVLAAVAIMSVLGAFARSAEQAGNLQSIVATAFAMLGGTFVPIPADGGWLTSVARFVPNSWVLRGFSEMAGGGTEAAFPAAGVLIAMALGVSVVGFGLVARTVKP